ncbi:MAG: hypothetical protein KC656_23410 [Myxococcales bacterium]|nr:hypothetical protein [Myxococcales bacterium]MCB9692055.1 hypothetical protein [Alphaproteobacteria bacterium]
MNPAQKVRTPDPTPMIPEVRPREIDPRDVEAALAEIAREVRQDPEGFLARTRVPGGGE